MLDWLVDLGRRSGHRLMLRLVKGAYWDSEIKRAQVDGLDGFPVFTRKIHTDVSYLACARKLLAAPDAVFPQFATHNAYTVAAVLAMAEEGAGDGFQVGHYEFQCLHGMGEPLYEEVVGHNKLNRPCRIYAPVGTHETLLAYLVRRLLENGANSSFVNRIQDPAVPVADLAADPVALVAARQPVGRHTSASPCRATCSAPRAPTPPGSTSTRTDSWRRGLRPSGPAMPGAPLPRPARPVRASKSATPPTIATWWAMWSRPHGLGRCRAVPAPAAGAPARRDRIGRPRLGGGVAVGGLAAPGGRS